MMKSMLNLLYIFTCNPIHNLMVNNVLINERDNCIEATSTLSDNVIINECHNGKGATPTLSIKVSDNVIINECDNGDG